MPGHEIVGTIVKSGKGVVGFHPGKRIGVGWLGLTCGKCRYCRDGRENLCDHPQFTGYTLNGGYAQYVAADHQYCFPVPELYGATEAAPLLCAGLIGYRSYRMLGERAKKIGMYGFGAAAHIISQVAVHQKKQVYAFTRQNDTESREFARNCGCVWAGSSEDAPPDELDGAIIFAPVGRLIPAALRAVGKGGIVVCGGIHMSEIPAFPYSLLWEERIVRSVANVQRKDGIEFMEIAPCVPVRTTVEVFPLREANTVLDLLRSGKIHGAAVLEP